MRSRNRLRWLLAASAACLLAACTPTAPERNGQPQAVSAQDSSTASAPAVLAENERQQRVLAFLHHRYGASASTGAAWRDSWDDRAQRRARRVHRQLCSNQPAMIAGVQHSLVAVCTRLDDVVDPTTPGLIDFIVLRAASDDGLEVAMQRLDDPHGSHGVPGEVSVLQLGADLHGYRIENGWSGQGYALSSQRLLLVGNDGLTDAGSLRSHIDNTGAFDCDVDDCDGKRFSIDFVLAPDDSQRTLAVWPLQVHESGFDCQGPVAREHLLEFDTTRGRYPVPHALQREGC